MPNRISQDADAKTQELAQKLGDVMASIAITTKPVVITAVQRKVNIGDFETVDIYSGVALPVNLTDEECLDTEKLVAELERLNTEGFRMVSTETLKRYNMVKEGVKR